MKVYQELERIFKFRIFSNEEITPYLLKLSRMGKIDEPKKMALFTIILDRLGRIEDEQESYEEMIKAAIEKEVSKRFPVRADEPPIKNSGEEANIPNPILENAKEFTCDICGKTAKSDFGLQSHQRSHKSKSIV